jgi:DNA-binding transcriptional LysR family regulator
MDNFPRSLADVDLNLLYTLHEVARTGSVTAAAKRLGRSQPAISTRIHQLETQLGVRLLERAGRNVCLSPIGRVVCEDVARVVLGMDNMLDRVRATRDQPVGTLRIGALPTLCAYMLAPLVVQLTASHPHLRVELAPSLTAPQLDLLRAGDLDLLLSVGPVKAPNVRIEVVGEVDACLVMKREGAPRTRGPISTAAFARLPYVSYGRVGDPFFDEVATFVERCQRVAEASDLPKSRRTNVAETARVQVSNIQAIKQLVLEGAGVSILPRYTVIEPGLATRNLDGFKATFPLCVVTRPTGHRVPIVKAFVQLLVASLGRGKKN